MSGQHYNNKIKRLTRINEELEMQVEQLSRDSYSRIKEVQEVYDVLKCAIVIIDEQGRIVKTNKYAEDEIICSDTVSLYSTLGKKESIDKIKDLIDKQESSAEEFELRIFNYVRIENVSYICSLTMLEGYNGTRFLFLANEITSVKKEELKRSEIQRQLMEHSFKEGMAETAVSILHNIGNVLTSMVGSIESQSVVKKVDSLHSTMGSFLGQLTSMQDKKTLKDFFSDEAKIDQVLMFLQNFNDDIQQLSISTDELLKSIKHKSHHIGSIITVQQQYADLKKGIKSTVTNKKVLEDCLLINESKLLRPHIKLHCDIVEECSFPIEKNGFIQVLSNVLINSIESIEDKMSKDTSYTYGDIHIECYSSSENIKFVISDNGMGFDEETAKKLCGFGYSTKERSSGFGLHNCMNFINTQNGEFKITSAGIGKGATVEIDISFEKDLEDPTVI